MNRNARMLMSMAYKSNTGRPSDTDGADPTTPKARFGGGSDTDPRLVDYITALRAGNIETVLEMRLANMDNPALTTRFKTIETTLSGLIDVYVREIQILRLEVEGWKGICEAQDRLAEEGIEQSEALAAKQCQYRGLERIERALAFRKDHTEVDVPQLKKP